MEPHIAPNDKNVFYKYLDQSAHYFEYGSGGSTYQASIRTNVKTIHSVESDLEWYNKLIQLIKTNENVNIIFNEMDARPNTWGNPGPNSTINQQIAYSDQIVMLDKTLSNQLDFILIDGRFRVACCLKCFDVINDKCLIAFDDFLDRPHYHIVLDYYDIVEQTQDNRLVILKKKNDKCPPKELIEKYEKIPA